MKVLYLVDKYPTKNQPKYGKYPAILKMIHNEGWNVDMAAYLAHKTQSVWKWQKTSLERKEGAGNRSLIYKDYTFDNLIRILMFFFRRKVSSWGLNVRLGRIIYKVLERRLIRFVETQGKPDIIHIYGIQAHAGFIGPRIASSLANHFQVPLVFNVHEAISYSYVKGGVPKAVLECFKATSLFAPVSQPLGEHWKSIVPEITELSMQAIPNPVSESIFKLGSKANKETQFKIVHISKLDANKNLNIIIKAFLGFLKLAPQAELQLIGNDKLTDQAKAIWDRGGSSPQIKLLGKKSRREIADIMASAHAYVQASTLETFGIPLVEAMMSGLPVIATRSCGPESYIKEFNGLVLEQPKVEILQQAFLSLYHAYENYKPDVIRKYALEHFSEKAVSRQLIEAYTRLDRSWQNKETNFRVRNWPVNS